MTIAELLSQSRAAHLRYRSLHDESKNSSGALMTASLSEAYQRRKEAHDLDPEHLDPAWAADLTTPWHPRANRGVGHDELMQFYMDQLA